MSLKVAVSRSWEPWVIDINETRLCTLEQLRAFLEGLQPHFAVYAAQIDLSLRRAGIGRQVHPCRHSVMSQFEFRANSGRRGLGGLRPVQAMDADRTILDDEAQTVAEISTAYVKGHKKEADVLFDVMHAATLAGVDTAPWRLLILLLSQIYVGYYRHPAPSPPPAHRSRARSLAPGPWPLHYVADRLQPLIERVRSLLNTSANRPSWDGDALGSTRVILADALQTLGDQSGQDKPLELAGGGLPRGARGIHPRACPAAMGRDQ
jgi:hypothetical protein